MQMSFGRGTTASPLKSDCVFMVYCHSQVAAALLGSAAHKNPNVRAKVAAHLDACVQQDPHKIRGEPHSAQPLEHAPIVYASFLNQACCCRDLCTVCAAVPAIVSRLLSAAAVYLEEGISETRAHGKGILCSFARHILQEDQLPALLDKCVPRASLRIKVEEVCSCLCFYTFALLPTMKESSCAPSLLPCADSATLSDFPHVHAASPSVMVSSSVPPISVCCMHSEILCTWRTGDWAGRIGCCIPEEGGAWVRQVH
jgi:hypothetical protein